MALVDFDQSISCGAVSKINNQIAASMSATIPQSGNISINQYIRNREIYFSNEEECKADFAEFNQKVETLAKSIVN